MVFVAAVSVAAVLAVAAPVVAVAAADGKRGKPD